jgi:ribosomal protein L20A (L18A)
MGSRHRLKRRSVRIDGVKSLKAEEISDHVVKHLMEAKK